MAKQVGKKKATSRPAHYDEKVTFNGTFGQMIAISTKGAGAKKESQINTMRILFIISILSLLFGCASSNEDTLKKLNNHLHSNCLYFDSTRSISLSQDTLVVNLKGQKDWIPLHATYISVGSESFKNDRMFFVKFNGYGLENCCLVTGDNAYFKEWMPNVSFYFSNANGAQRAYILLSKLQIKIKKIKGEDFDF